jgi:hypothetical protein
MECTRCHGIMVTETLRDYGGTFAKVVAWRCPSCGDVLDPVILRNRTSRSAQKQKTSSRNEDDRLLA